MLGRRFIICSALTAGFLLNSACNRRYLRSEPARPIAPMPSPLAREMAAQPPISAPAPPPPPSSIQPPRPDALSGIVPPIPRSGQPSEMPAANLEPAGAPIVPVSYQDDGTGGPIREKLEELKQKRQERREERQEKRNPTVPTLPPLPDPTTTPTPPASPPTSDRPLDVSGPLAIGGTRRWPESPPTSDRPLDDLAQVKQLVDAAVARHASIPGYEARLVKQEVLNGKKLPREESIYRFRHQPLSVYSQVTSEAGRGRELLYVQGQFGNKLHVVTGQGDNILVGAGYKTELDPDSRTATAKSRWKVSEAGFSRNLNSLTKAIATSDARRKLVQLLGNVKRPEYPYELIGVEFSVRPGDELHLPKGGLRRLYFDPNPESPGYRLPVLVQTFDEKNQEVEYYCFDRFKIPSAWTDADWNPSRLGKK